MGQPVGDDTDSGQAESLQLANSAGQGCHCWHLYVHQFFNLGRVILEKTIDERRKTWLMILTIEPLLMPTIERRLQGKVEEIVVRTSLYTNTSYQQPLGLARLVFQEEIVFE
jgi:hypothetical protein